MKRLGSIWTTPRALTATAAVCLIAVCAFVITTWPLATTTTARLVIILLSFVLQAAGAFLVVRNVLAQDKLDKKFLAGLAEIEVIRHQQAERMKESFGQPAPAPPRPQLHGYPEGMSHGAQLGAQAGDALSAYVRERYAPRPSTPMERQQEILRRIGRTDAFQALTKFSANNLGDVLPKTHETVTDYLEARASASTLDRWIGVVLLVAGLVVVGTLS